MGKSTVSPGSWRNRVGTGQPWPAAVKTCIWGCPRDLSVCAQETLCGMMEVKDWDPGTTEYLNPDAGRSLLKCIYRVDLYVYAGK